MHYPIVIENTIKDQLTPSFWADLAKHLATVEQRPDAFWDGSLTAEDLAETAFSRDHAEHIGSWLWDPVCWPVFNDHGITGTFAYVSEDGDHRGIAFLSGFPHNVVVKTVVETRGRKKP